MLALSGKWQMISMVDFMFGLGANFNDTSTNILSRSFFFDLLDNCMWAVGLNAPNMTLNTGTHIALPKAVYT